MYRAKSVNGKSKNYVSGKIRVSCISNRVRINNGIPYQYLMASKKARTVPCSPSNVAYVRNNEVFNTGTICVRARCENVRLRCVGVYVERK